MMPIPIHDEEHIGQSYILRAADPTLYYWPLPVLVFDDQIMTCWQPSPADIAAIVAGARIELMFTCPVAGLPPMGMYVEGVR